MSQVNATFPARLAHGFPSFSEPGDQERSRSPLFELQESCASYGADANRDGEVNFADILTVISSWGGCQ